jgi:hypothetical protein
MSQQTPRTDRFPVSTNSYVQYSELRKSHAALELECARLAQEKAELVKDAERYIARRASVFRTRRQIEMPQGKNWKPTTMDEFNSEYDAQCDKEVAKQRAARAKEGKS